MKRTGVFYLIFFISLGVTVTATYLMTQTHVSQQLAAEKQNAIIAVKTEKEKSVKRVESKVKQFESKLDAKSQQLAIAQVNVLLNDTKLELYRVSLSNANPARLNSLIQKLKVAQTNKAVKKAKQYHATLSNLIVRMEAYPQGITQSRERFRKRLLALKHRTKKMKQLIHAALSDQNLTSLSRRHTLIISRMLAHIQRIESDVDNLHFMLKSFYVTNFPFYRINAKVNAIKIHISSLLNGDPKNKIAALQTTKVKAILIALNVQIDQFGKQYLSATKLYQTMAQKPKELETLIATIDKQKALQ